MLRLNDFQRNKKKKYLYLSEIADDFKIFYRQKLNFLNAEDLFSSIDSQLDFITTENYQSIFDKINSEIKEFINNKKIAYQTSELGDWYYIPRWFRVFLGILAAVFILPAILVIFKSSLGYFRTFFFAAPDVEFKNQCENAKKEIDTYFKDLRISYSACKLAKPIFKHQLQWIGDKDAQWEFAYEKLTVSGKLRPEGEKLRRKDYPQDLDHSFIISGREILAIAKGHLAESKKSKLTVKHAENKTGDSLVLKRTKYSNIRELQDDTLQDKESDIAIDVQIAFPPVQRQSPGNQRFFKKYIPYMYAGTPLSLYMKSSPPTIYECFDLAIQLANIVSDLHEGRLSITGKLYTHSDLHPENITVDNNGHVHLIDFGRAKPINNGLDMIKQEYEYKDQLCRITTDVIIISVVIENTIFKQSTEIMPQPLVDFFQALSDYRTGKYSARQFGIEEKHLKSLNGICDYLSQLKLQLYPHRNLTARY